MFLSRCVIHTFEAQSQDLFLQFNVGTSALAPAPTFHFVGAGQYFLKDFQHFGMEVCTASKL